MDAPSELGLLGRLPIELRNTIFDLVLVTSNGFTLQAYGQPRLGGLMSYVVDGKPYDHEAGRECAPVDHKRKVAHPG